MAKYTPRLTVARQRDIDSAAGNVYTKLQGLSGEDLKKGLLEALGSLSITRGTKLPELVQLFKGQPITESQWVNYLIELNNDNEVRISKGLRPFQPIEAGLVLADLEEIKSTDPILYAQVMTNPKVYVTSWEKGAVSKYSKIATGKANFLDNILDLKTKNRYFQDKSKNIISEKDFFDIIISNSPSKHPNYWYYAVETQTMLYLGKTATGTPELPNYYTYVKAKESNDFGLVDFIEIQKVGQQFQNPADYKESQVGHLVADSSQNLEAQYRMLRYLVSESIREYKHLVKLPINDSKLTNLAKERIEVFLDVYRALKTTVIYAKTIDKLILETKTVTRKNSRQFSDQVLVAELFKKLVELTYAAGNSSIFLIEEEKNTTYSGNTLKVPVELSVALFAPENRQGNEFIKGWVLQADLISYWKGFLAGTTSSSQYIQKLVGRFGSSSYLSQSILKALDKIFNTNQFSKQIIEQKNKKKTIFKGKRGKTKNLNSIFEKFENFSTKRKSIIKARKISVRDKSKRQTRLAPATQQTQNIVPLINAEIYKYVRAQMSENTLQYRTGEFARSVQVLSAQENAAVQYTYKKNPYSDVFSPGKSYLATEERNPAKIIDAAIKRLGQDRFQKVFRTEEV